MTLKIQWPKNKYTTLPYDDEDEFSIPAVPEGFSWKLNHVYDYDGDTSHLGVFKHQKAPPSGEWYIERDSDGAVLYNHLHEKVREIDNGYYSNHDARFYVSCNYRRPDDTSGWSHVSEEDKAKVIAEHGSLEEANIHYFIEDYKLLERYYENAWGFMGVDLDLLWLGESVAFGALYGIEDSSDESYFREVENEMARSAIQMLLDDREWWLETTALYFAFRSLKQVPKGKDLEYWDRVALRWESAKLFRFWFNDGEEWKGTP